jgi:hypothetical protein
MALSIGELRHRLWEPKSLTGENWYHSRIGPLDLWVRRSPADWYVAHRREPERVKAEAPPSPLHPAQTNAQVDRLTWNRWVAGEEEARVLLVPCLPNRAVVIRPRYPLNVPKGKEVLFFVSLPVWVRVLVGEAQSITLCELPTVVLSNTWFGDPITGELCYSLKTKVLRQIGMVENHPHMAVCPVLIRNQAFVDLDFQRICIRVEYLSLYRGRTRLWTNQVEVQFHGEDLNSTIITGREAPDYEPAAERLSEARLPSERSLLKKSFSFLKALTGI